MRRLIAKPWAVLARLAHDDGGAVLATEWLLVTTVLVLGLIPGLIAIRQGLLAELGDIASATTGLDQSYGYTGQQLGSRNDAENTGDGIRAAADDGRGYDPVAEAAARITTARVKDGRGDRFDRRLDRPNDRGIRAAGYGRNTVRNAGRDRDERCLQAFTAGSAFLEERHLDNVDRGQGIRATSTQAIGPDGRPCD